MKKGARKWMVVVACLLAVGTIQAQKVDEERMQRDIEVAENVMGTLIKQKFDKRNGFFPFEVEGTYMAGYGVTFRVPGDFSNGWFLTEDIRGAVVVGEASSYSYSIRSEDDNDGPPGVRVRSRTTPYNRDSLATVYNTRIIEASKEFLTDYGDLISQLAPEERIMITNRGDNNRIYYPGMKGPKRTLLSVEAAKSDMTQVRQGKMTREQFQSKIKVVNATNEEETDPDLELLSSIFSRLYRVDLSKTYYTNDNVYFEKMRDFGAIFYMTVYSSEETDYKKWRMPTQNVDNLDQVARDKKVVELYPLFEKDVKENMLEYGRTVRSLKENESLVINVRLTKCKDCGIPSTLELSVKNDVIKQYNLGQLSKDAALAKISVKKGPAQ